jgi:hypothetical protein
MSRRRLSRDYAAKHLGGDQSVHHTFQQVDVLCDDCERRTGRPHRIGLVVRQHGRDMLSVGLERVDGPNGETKVLAVCPTCRKEGGNAAPQVRWQRLSAMLDELAATGVQSAEIRPS